jgi:hypothetical protein
MNCNDAASIEMVASIRAKDLIGVNEIDVVVIQNETYCAIFNGIRVGLAKLVEMKNVKLYLFHVIY